MFQFIRSKPHIRPTMFDRCNLSGMRGPLLRLSFFFVLAEYPIEKYTVTDRDGITANSPIHYQKKKKK